jgi:hypothetical protein
MALQFYDPKVCTNLLLHTLYEWYRHKVLLDLLNRVKLVALQRT